MEMEHLYSCYLERRQICKTADKRKVSEISPFEAVLIYETYFQEHSTKLEMCFNFRNIFIEAEHLLCCPGD